MMARKKTAGFTLIELIMVIVIMGVISVVIGHILFQSFQTFITAQSVSDDDWQGLLSMNKFTNDVHNIRSMNDISTITASSFSFVDMSGTTVTYALSGSSLQRSGTTLASGVTGMAFAYYDKNYTVTSTAANVRYITFSTTLTQNNLSLTFSTMAGTRGMP
jgi:prepilin-type N-terminal cleavage/methylation domain-containing protein